MVGDCDIGIPARLCRRCHLLNLPRPVAPNSVHLEIAANLMEGVGVLRSPFPGFRQCQEVLANLGNRFFSLRRMPEPFEDLLVQVGTNASEFCQALPTSKHVFSLCRPKKGSACSASEGPLQRLLCMFSRPSQQFGNIGISHVF